MSIIKGRLTRAVSVTLPTSVATRARNPNSARRGSYTKGVSLFPHHVGFRLNDNLWLRLQALCAETRVERGVVIRDALNFYLGIAEQEGLKVSDVPTVIRKRAYTVKPKDPSSC